MKMTGADLVVRALTDEGIRFAFGIPGTHNIELYDALAETTAIRTILVTDEQSAGFMADGVWRASGEMACVNLVPGAGLTHALSGIAEAYMDGIPILVLACGIRRGKNQRAFQLHDIDQAAIVTPVTKGVFRPETGAEIYAAIRNACGLARAGTPGPVMVEVGVDLYLSRHEVAPTDLAPPVLLPIPEPGPADFAAALKLLRAPGARPLIYVGAGAATAESALVQLAELLDAPVATTIQGKGVFPESHPLFLWNGFGRAAPAFAQRVARRCTVTLAVGCRFSEVGSGSYGLTPPGPLIHVDINPEVFNRNFPTDLAIMSDGPSFLRALAERCRGDESGREPSNELRETIRAGHDQVRSEWARHRSPDGVTPSVLLDAIQRVLGPETVYTTDSGNGTFLAMEGLRLDHPRQFLAPVDYSCMGYSIPAAIGAKLARPEAPVVALAGDGAFLMTGLELLTAAHEKLPLVVFVLRDRELAQIAQFQTTAMNRKTASVLPDYDLASIVEGVGVRCLHLARDADIAATLREIQTAMRIGTPIVVDTAIDYSSPSFFTQGVVKTNLGRLPWVDRLRLIARALMRRVPGRG